GPLVRAESDETRRRGGRVAASIRGGIGAGIRAKRFHVRPEIRVEAMTREEEPGNTRGASHADVAAAARRLELARRRVEQPYRAAVDALARDDHDRAVAH